MPDREWVQSERRAENPGIRKEEDELRLNSWIQIKVNGMGRKKVQQFGAPGSETSSIPLKNPKEVRRRRGSRRRRRQPEARNGGEGVEGEDTKCTKGG